MDEFQPRMKWLQTVDLIEHDLSCHEDGRIVARIYPADSLREGRWFWTLLVPGHQLDRSGAECSGYADSRGAAMYQAEKAWARAKDS